MILELEANMNSLTRFFRSVRSNIATDNSFETYYGYLIRNQSEGAPSAAEARRDYMAVRASLERVSLY